MRAVIVFFCLLFSLISISSGDDVLFNDSPEMEQTDASLPVEHEPNVLEVELDRRNAKIRTLESLVHDKLNELKRKDEVIADKERIIQEKSLTISSLHSEMSSIQKNHILSTNEQLTKALAQITELETKNEELVKELESQNKWKLVLEGKIKDANEVSEQLRSELNDVQKNNDQKKAKIHKLQGEVKIAEEELRKAKHDTMLKAIELNKVHDAWLPPWLVSRLILYQSFVVSHWNEKGKPAFDATVFQVYQKKAAAEKWAEPHITTFKTKLVPTVREHLVAARKNAEPHLQLIAKQSVDFYQISRNKASIYIMQLLECADPYFQGVKEFTRPHIAQIATAAKPHVEKVQDAARPHVRMLIDSYGALAKSMATYHRQVQGSLHDLLKSHELTKSFAIREIEWFAASAILSLPVIFLFRICSSAFSKQPKKRTRTTHTNRSQRKVKQVTVK